MAVKKATTTEDAVVLGGPPAQDPTPTIAPGDPAPESANLTDSKPDDPSDKPVKLTSPWGTSVTISSDANLEDFKNLGFKVSK